MNLGEETVNGRHTLTWEVSETMRGQSGTQYVWVDVKLHCIVKMQMGPSTMELQNIGKGPQPASIFALPTGYQVMDGREPLTGFRMGSGGRFRLVISKPCRRRGN
jgi:hypothetical protein